MKRMLLVALTALAMCGPAVAADKPDAARVPGVSELKTAADKGNPVAQNNLAAMFATGEGVAQDYKQAAKWYEMAAEQGYAIAQHNLGGLFEHGLGVPQDPATAAVWYALAADQGDGWAQVSLASLHAAGKLVQNDISTAYRWSVIASNSKEKDIKAAATQLVQQLGPKLSAPARAEAEKMAKVWRPGR